MQCPDSFLLIESFSLFGSISCSDRTLLLIGISRSHELRSLVHEPWFVQPAIVFLLFFLLPCDGYPGETVFKGSVCENLSGVVYLFTGITLPVF